MINIDTSHSFYQPLWVRILIVAICAGWAVVEFVNEEPFWATVVGGIAIYAGYALLIAFKPAAPQQDAPKNELPPEA